MVKESPNARNVSRSTRTTSLYAFLNTKRLSVFTPPLPLCDLCWHVWLHAAARGATLVPAGAVPEVVIVFSGKRKCGKDYITERLQAR